MEFSLSQPERQRLASLLAATATLLLLLFSLAVALPLLPPKLVDPFWQLAFCSALCSNGFLALLAVLLLNLAAAIDPAAEWLQGRRQLVGGLCRWVALAFLLLIPLQGLAAWRALDWRGAVQSRAANEELQRIGQFRRAVVSAGSVAALQANLAAIQAPPLGPEDQRQSLAALKASMLSQLQAAEQQARRASAGAAATNQGLNGISRSALVKDILRGVLLSLGLALAFAAAAQRKGSELSLRAEWRQAVEGVLEANLSRRADTLAWRQEQELLHEELREQELEELQAQQDNLGPADPEPGQHAALGRPRGRPGRGAVDAAYFETLAAEDDTTPG